MLLYSDYGSVFLRGEEELQPSVTQQGDITMMSRIGIAMFGAFVAMCAIAHPTPGFAQSMQCVDNDTVITIDGTVTSVTPQPYTAGGSTVAGHWIEVSAPSISCGGFSMYVFDIGNYGVDGQNGQLCHVGAAIEAKGTLAAPDADHPNGWSFFSESMIPGTYSSDFTCH